MPGLIEWIKTRGSLRGLARWLFLATLVIAPWLYGGATAGSIALINAILALVFIFWVISLLVDRRAPFVPASLAMIVGVILLQGWWMALNAHSIYDRVFRWFLPVAPFFPQLAGSTDYVLSSAMMVRVTALISVIVLVADMVARSSWLLRLWTTVVISGGAVASLGLVQKASGAKMIFWQPPIWPPLDTFFATYVYHANAGAFLNLVLPATVGLVCWLFMRSERRVARAFLIAGAVIVLLAIVSNTSRMAQAIAGLLLIVLLVTVARPLVARAVRAEKSVLIIGTIIFAIVIFAIAQAAHLDRPLARWRAVAQNLPVDQRWAADRAAVSGIADAGAFGLGPGVFRAVFPRYQQASQGKVQGTWRFLHNDYLQTILEWGWVGSFSFAVLFFGGIAVGLRNYRKAEVWSSRQRILLACVVLALGGVALHATVDFPLQIYSIQLLVATYLGICWGSGVWGERKKEE